MLDLEKRLDQTELMDTQTFPIDVMRDVLKFLAITNRYFGGSSIIISQFKSWSRRWKKGETIRILDVGTGGAEIPIALVDWARAHNILLHITAVDLVDDIVTIAKENVKDYPEIFVEKKDALDPTFAVSGFDYVMASLFLHHIPPDQTLKVVKAFDRLAQRGIIISDLARSWPSYIAVRLLSRFIGNWIVRNDAPISVQRSFTVRELMDIAKQAGANYLVAAHEPFFRVSLAGEKPLPSKAKFPTLELSNEWLEPSL